ncbi:MULTISPECIES: Bbp16 family capsid cement protein [unclassified Roseobacter]|uniref:Bbp16 family capsid cement protein n=1 Tax=unclassified Roseobacter TaxID=196798 RepID=UPI001491F374|nr:MULTISPECIES: hypothetical protein [unclassified Roseobacter]NNW55506.1 hypothetical protein [Roseobacter sp. HKCCD8284]NNY17307.1 hypothetical protein [Roseobacter sp. HKCCD8191]
MILDKNLKFADALDVSAATGTALVGDVIDLTANAVNPGRGQPIYLVIQVTTAFTSGTSSDVTFQLASDSVAAIATNGTQTVHYVSDTFDESELPVGTVLTIALPQGRNYERYLGLQVVTAGAATTAGAISAFLVWDVQNNDSYPDAVN